jgi:hypothetical protein
LFVEQVDAKRRERGCQRNGNRAFAFTGIGFFAFGIGAFRKAELA